MGNGALPNGPSYRARPRLYLNRPVRTTKSGPLVWVQLTSRREDALDSLLDRRRDALLCRAPVPGGSITIAAGRILHRFSQFGSNPSLRQGQEVNRAAREHETAHARAKQQLADVTRRIAGIVEAIEDGMYAPALKARMAELEAEKARLEATAASLPAPQPVRLHPRLPEMYRKLVEELHIALSDPLIREEAAEAIRGLITRIVLTPRPAGDGLEVNLHGDIAAILQLCDRAPDNKRPKTEHPGPDGPGCQLSVVAGARIGRDRHLLTVSI